MKHLFLIILCLFSIGLYADFIVPTDDPVYPFLEMMYRNGYLPDIDYIYPIYYNTIITDLDALSKSELPPLYIDLLKHHMTRLGMNYPEGYSYAFLPLGNIVKSLDCFNSRNHPRKRLITLHKDEAYIYFSGKLGSMYDSRKSAGERLSRRFDYGSMEWAGNFTKNFGFFTSFWLGNYKGDKDFLLDESYLENFLKPTDYGTLKYDAYGIQSEVDFKNKYLNFSSGYGTYQIGKTISSSLILSSDITPYGYLKLYKSWWNLNYTSILGQLTADSLNSHLYPELQYDQMKSFALNSLSFKGENLLVGLGSVVIYGERSFDLAYSTPFVFFSNKWIDQKQYHKDNVGFFGFSTLNIGKNSQIYTNFFLDDFSKRQIFTSMSGNRFAGQMGYQTSLTKIPLEFSGEVTAIRPWTYSHNQEGKKYTHDNKILGYKYGANLLNYACRIKYLATTYDLTAYYENMQQGSFGSNPFILNNHMESSKIHFLEGDLRRLQNLKIMLCFYPVPEIQLNLKYQHKVDGDYTKNYIFTGLELKY